jgi:hypothetical protein
LCQQCLGYILVEDSVGNRGDRVSISQGCVAIGTASVDDNQRPRLE